MRKRSARAALVCWLPVVAVVAAVFVAPSSTVAAGGAVLQVRPGADTYGGEQLTFSGNIGVRERRAIHLQRRDNATAAWADVPDPRAGPRKGKVVTEHTKADGSFSFNFPSPAMNGCYFRVVSGRYATPQHQFMTVLQDAEMSLVGAATINAPFKLAVDTVRVLSGKPTKPILAGRTVTLQQRDDAGEWRPVATGATGQIGRDGQVAFVQTVSTPGTVVYRVRLESWTADGDRIGWFPSLPLYVDVARSRRGEK